MNLGCTPPSNFVGDGEPDPNPASWGLARLCTLPAGAVGSAVATALGLGGSASSVTLKTGTLLMQRPDTERLAALISHPGHNLGLAPSTPPLLGLGLQQSWRAASSVPPAVKHNRGSRPGRRPGMAHTSQEQRWSIIGTWKQLGNINATAEATGMSCKTVRRWVQRYVETNGVEPKPKPGRPQSLTAAGAEAAHKQLLSEDSSGAAHVAQQLHHQGITAAVLHKATIIRHARRVAAEKGVPIRAVRGRPAKRLSDSIKHKRLQFARANQRRCWARVMFTDRKRFYFRYPGASVKPVTWVERGSSKQAPTVNRPLCLNVYMGITRHGVTMCHVAGSSKHSSQYLTKQQKPARNITAAEYRDVLQRTLLPEGGRIFSRQGLGSWVLQQDNDPSHKAAAASVREYNSRQSSSIQLLEGWPASSPDLNLIENVWAYVQARVDARGCSNFEQFTQAVLAECQAVPSRMLANLFDSMPKRLAKVIERGGDKTGY